VQLSGELAHLMGKRSGLQAENAVSRAENRVLSENIGIVLICWLYLWRMLHRISIPEKRNLKNI
jgi:hypothetical protein